MGDRVGSLQAPAQAVYGHGPLESSHGVIINTDAAAILFLFVREGINVYGPVVLFCGTVLL